MKQQKTKLLILLAFLSTGILSCHSGHKEKTADGVTYQTEKGFIRLQVCRDDIIRVVVSLLHHSRFRIFISK